MIKEVENMVHRMNELAGIGELCVEFEHLEAVYGFAYRGYDDNYLVLINDEMSKESQLKTLLHEAKHICSHFGLNEEMKKCEHEADTFVNECVDNIDIVMNLAI